MSSAQVFDRVLGCRGVLELRLDELQPMPGVLDDLRPRLGPNADLLVVATGEYMEVEPGEAEWTLDTLDALFGFYFVEPARTAARKAALAAKTGS